MKGKIGGALAVIGLVAASLIIAQPASAGTMGCHETNTISGSKTSTTTTGVVRDGGKDCAYVEARITRIISSIPYNYKGPISGTSTIYNANGYDGGHHVRGWTSGPWGWFAV